MVLNDITNDYTQFINTLNHYNTSNSYINSALSMINEYQERINILADTFLKSQKTEANKSTLVTGLNSLQTSFSVQIANMNTSLRNTTRLITEIEAINFISPSVKANANILCNSLNKLMDITETYAANKIKDKPNTAVFFDLISELENFKNVHVQIYSNHEFLINIESELLEKLPFEDAEDYTFYTLDVRSYKTELNISSFSNDLSLLANCLQHLDRLVNPDITQSIYLRKIESGSLKAIFGSDKIDFSILPDIISNISNAIRTWRLTPVERDQIVAETEKTKAETALINAQTEAQLIQNECSKLTIVNSQIDYICDKLQIDSTDPANKEQIQKFCLPLIDYIERNPIGSFNGIPYDISKEVHLLENSEK